jgi:hypothetical protein
LKAIVFARLQNDKIDDPNHHLSRFMRRSARGTMALWTSHHPTSSAVQHWSLVRLAYRPRPIAIASQYLNIIVVGIDSDPKQINWYPEMFRAQVMEQTTT